MADLTRRAALLALVLMPAVPALAEAGGLTVFAAASLKTALDQIAAAFQARTGSVVTVSYDSSAKLAKQIAAGAPADLFISASDAWMDELATGRLIKPETRKSLLGNRLVLVAGDTGAAPVTIAKGFALAGLLGDGKLAMGLVDSVPAGQYGRQALTSLGVWDAVWPKVAQADLWHRLCLGCGGG
jgi:molybdate transport system substrate-binding protein